MLLFWFWYIFWDTLQDYFQSRESVMFQNKEQTWIAFTFKQYRLLRWNTIPLSALLKPFAVPIVLVPKLHLISLLKKYSSYFIQMLTIIISRLFWLSTHRLFGSPLMLFPVTDLTSINSSRGLDSRRGTWRLGIDWMYLELITISPCPIV